MHQYFCVTCSNEIQISHLHIVRLPNIMHICVFELAPRPGAHGNLTRKVTIEAAHKVIKRWKEENGREEAYGNPSLEGTVAPIISRIVDQIMEAHR